MHRHLLILSSLSVSLSFATYARATPTENLGLRVLPTPGNMTIDGNANDWDLSGGIFTCDDVQNQRARFALWFHAMYDAENLYLLAHFIDETPLNNPGQTIADYGFAGDCLQGTHPHRARHAAGTWPAFYLLERA